MAVTLSIPEEDVSAATDHRFSKDDLLRVYADVGSFVDSADFHDGGFFTTHRARYVHLLNRMQALAPVQQFPRVLELGSYHLHLSMLMTRLGYQVKGVDLPVFSEKTAVVRRAAQFGIANHSYVLDVLGKPVRIPYDDDAADVVVCTEMLEHITFNPVRFWSEVYRIVRPEGLLMITTPNSLSLLNTLAQLKRLLLRQSIGIEVRGILNSISSGHHWKEYSLGEIRDYFVQISPDFQLVTAEFYEYRDPAALRNLHRLVHWFQEHAMPERFRSELLIAFKVQKSRGVQIADPDATINLE